jgi:hypothetical protein
MKNDLITVLHKSVFRSAADANHLNKRVSFKPDAQERINKLDIGSRIISRNRHPKNKDRDINNDVSTRSRSKITYPNQNAGISTRSKLQVACILIDQGLLFPLHDIIPLSYSSTRARDDL